MCLTNPIKFRIIIIPREIEQIYVCFPFFWLNSDPTSLAEDFKNEAFLPQNIPEELVWHQD